jgi:hypothetical protein
LLILQERAVFFDFNSVVHVPAEVIENRPAAFPIDLLSNEMYIFVKLRVKHKLKKVMGRPPLGKQGAKGVLITARFTQAEADQINREAKYLGLTKSQFVRKALLSTNSGVN